MAAMIPHIFPSSPGFTEADLPDQSGKVFIVTGSSGGLGKELANILYSKNSKVYIAARSEAKANAAIDEIRERFPASSGELVYLHLDLNDLSTIKKTAEEFLAKEQRLDVLWNNAGVMVPPQGSTTAQGYELQMGTNCVAPFLLTRYLYPTLLATAKRAPLNSVRVVWVSSGVAQIAPNPAIDFSNLDFQREESAWQKYTRSKAGNVLLAAEGARRSKDAGDGIIHVSPDPGALRTDLQKNTPFLQLLVIKTFLREAKFGAYTELFAGFHPAINGELQNVWVAPFGKIGKCRKDLLEEEIGRQFWEWIEAQVAIY
ncbi:NAD(P)-binding protein [Thozetella sp. PMI_491]|nr:NAD(P)-binding protein [Thozetella sp. PMI_491]